MVKLKNETWWCDVCGEKSDSDDWELKSIEVNDAEDYLVIKCPKCHGSTFYKYSRHTRIDL